MSLGWDVLTDAIPAGKVKLLKNAAVPIARSSKALASDLAKTKRFDAKLIDSLDNMGKALTLVTHHPRDLVELFLSSDRAMAAVAKKLGKAHPSLVRRVRDFQTQLKRLFVALTGIDDYEKCKQIFSPPPQVGPGAPTGGGTASGGGGGGGGGSGGTGGGGSATGSGTAIAIGADHTCAVLSSGGVDCWGYNVWGQLGNGITTNSSMPVGVSGVTNATAIAAGAGHTCAVLTSGGVDCWGASYAGQLGDGSNTGPDSCYYGTCSTTPVAVSGITNAIAIAAGRAHSCAVLTSGGVDCWGDNTSGQLGDGTNTGPDTCYAGVRGCSFDAGGGERHYQRHRDRRRRRPDVCAACEWRGRLLGLQQQRGAGRRHYRLQGHAGGGERHDERYRDRRRRGPHLCGAGERRSRLLG